MLCRGSWRRLFLECPHLRFDGLYVSRNTYIRQGVSEWKRDKGSCFLVTYFRYFRFFPDGTLLYRTSPLTVGKVAKSLMRNPCQAQQNQKFWDQHVFSGRYVIKVGCFAEQQQLLTAALHARSSSGFVAVPASNHMQPGHSLNTVPECSPYTWCILCCRVARPLSSLCTPTAAVRKSEHVAASVVFQCLVLPTGWTSRSWPALTGRTAQAQA